MKDLTITMEPDGWMEKTGGYAKDMTYRQYLVAKVVEGTLANPNCPEAINVTELAIAAYQVADEVIKVGK